MAYFSNTQKAKCVLWLAEYKNLQTVQKKLKQDYYEANPDAKEVTIKLPSEEEIRQWYVTFEETGSVIGEPRNTEGHRKLSNRKSFDLHKLQRLLSGRKSMDLHTRQIRRLSSQNSLDIHTTIYEKETGLLNFFGFKKIHKCHPYKMRLDNELDGSDIVARKKFAKVFN